MRRFSKAQDYQQRAEHNNIQPFCIASYRVTGRHNLVHLSALMTRACSAGDVRRASYDSHCPPHPHLHPPPTLQTRLISIARSHRNVQEIWCRYVQELQAITNFLHGVILIASPCLDNKTLLAAETPAQRTQRYHNWDKKT
jgi:hypothetical protein